MPLSQAIGLDYFKSDGDAYIGQYYFILKTGHATDLSISSVVSDTGGEGVFVWLDTKRNKVIAATHVPVASHCRVLLSCPGQLYISHQLILQGFLSIISSLQLLRRTKLGCA